MGDYRQKLPGGPKNISHDYELIWVIVSEIHGQAYSRYAYVKEQPGMQKRYGEWRKWVLAEFPKWKEANKNLSS
jgi:hypothetical protein